MGCRPFWRGSWFCFGWFFFFPFSFSVLSALVQEEGEGGISSHSFAKCQLSCTFLGKLQTSPIFLLQLSYHPKHPSYRTFLLFPGFCFRVCLQLNFSLFCFLPFEKRRELTAPLTSAPCSPPLLIGLSCHFPESECKS